ncbi:hypothetical protein ACOZ4I_06755 [Haloarcula salina]|uniref:hypothetical protein n=1 Tax=Haloarcula salina TaxID=1429914 RepID=UPI003C6F20DB
MVSRKTFLVLALVALVALVPLTGIALIVAPPGFLYDHYSHYDYTASVSTNESVTNATFYLPFPEQSAANATVDDIWIYDPEGEQQVDWDVQVVETAHGQMLRLHVDQLAGASRYTLYTYAENGSLVDRREIQRSEIPEDMTNRELVVDPTTYQIYWSVVVNETIETRHPVGNGTFLSPARDVRPVECTDAWGETDNCATFTSVVGATYETEEPTTVTVGTVGFDGWNEWGFGLSNSFNTFSATTGSGTYTDADTGWVVVDGRLHAGMGRYDGPAR